MTKYARTYRQEDHEDSDVIHVLREVDHFLWVTQPAGNKA